MKWRFEDESLADFAVDAPQLANTSLVIGPIADMRDELFPEELAELAPMVEKRQLGFSSGRRAAHLAQAALNLPVRAIARDDRAPVWPSDCIGSITHTDALAGAAVSTQLKGIGLDMEEWGRVDDKLFRMLFTDREVESLRTLPHEAATVAFSAKESGYKAVFPLGRQFIGFKQAEIKLDWPRKRFTIAYIGEHAPNKALNSGFGFWQVHADHVLTVFVIE